MNGKLNRALNDIDESLIYEAAYAERAEHRALRSLPYIALPLTAAAAVGIFFAAQGAGNAGSGEVNSGVSLIDAPAAMQPASAPSWANADAHRRLGGLLWNYDGTDSASAVPVCMDSEKVSKYYFGSNFPQLVCVNEGIAVFTDGVDGAVFFYDIAEDENKSETDRMVYSIDLTETVENVLGETPELACRYENIGYPEGGQTNGISVVAADNNGKTGIFFSVASYDEQENRGYDLYRIIYDSETESPVIIRATDTSENGGFTYALDGWEYREVALLNTPFVCGDGTSVTAKLDGWDFSCFYLDVTENGEQRALYPFKDVVTQVELPDFRGADVEEAMAWLSENGYTAQKIFTQDDTVEIGKVIDVQIGGDSAFVEISEGSGITGPFTEEISGITDPFTEVLGEERIALLTGGDECSGSIDATPMFPLACGVDEADIITSYFGYDEWRGGYHNGIDISYEGIGGSPIYAAQSGTVIAAYNDSCWHGGYGKYVVVYHGGGLSTLYAHCDSTAVYEGQKVSKGDILGYVGQTGWATGNCLHFEVRNGVSAVNPLELRYASEE